MQTSCYFLVNGVPKSNMFLNFSGHFQESEKEKDSIAVHNRLWWTLDSSTSDIITFDQNWYHQHSTFAGGKDLSNDAQIRAIGRMEPEICTKCSKSWVKNSEQNFLLLHLAAPSRWRFLRSFLTTSKPSRRSITAAKRKEKEKKERRKKHSKNRKA